VEARFAIEKLRQWLASRGVRFHMGEAVTHVETGHVHLHSQQLQAERIVVCPGTDLRTLFPQVFTKYQTQLCQLQMLRIRPPRGYHLDAAVMSDLSLVRYRGFTELPGAARLEDRLRLEVPRALQHGIHLIVVQSSDGCLVVGDSHQYGETMPPFVPAEAEELILAEMQRVLCLGHYEVKERWTGIYPSGAQDAFIETVLPDVQVLSVTSGSGMSTAFALAEECLKGERIAV
jgi:FAD dependent oxidoreductase TIGR03364